MARISSVHKANELKRALANAKLRVKEQQGKSNKKAIKRAKAAGLNLNVFTRECTTGAGAAAAAAPICASSRYAAYAFVSWRSRATYPGSRSRVGRYR